MQRKLINKKVKGHLSQYEDWWYLVVEDDGTTYIEHEWDHVNVNGFAKNADSERIEPSDYFKLSGDALDARIAELLA